MITIVIVGNKLPDKICRFIFFYSYWVPKNQWLDGHMVRCLENWHFVSQAFELTTIVFNWGPPTSDSPWPNSDMHESASNCDGVGCNPTQFFFFFFEGQMRRLFHQWVDGGCWLLNHTLKDLIILFLKAKLYVNHEESEGDVSESSFDTCHTSLSHSRYLKPLQQKQLQKPGRKWVKQTN